MVTTTHGHSWYPFFFFFFSGNMNEELHCSKKKASQTLGTRDTKSKSTNYGWCHFSYNHSQFPIKLYYTFLGNKWTLERSRKISWDTNKKSKFNLEQLCVYFNLLCIQLLSPMNPLLIEQSQLSYLCDNIW